MKATILKHVLLIALVLADIRVSTQYVFITCAGLRGSGTDKLEFKVDGAYVTDQRSLISQNVQAVTFVWARTANDAGLRHLYQCNAYGTGGIITKSVFGWAEMW